MVWILYHFLPPLYVASLILFFMDTMMPKRAVNRFALVLLFCAFMCETILFMMRLRELGHAPVYSRYDIVFLASWMILLITLVVDAFFRVDLFLFFANVLGFAFVLFDSFAHQNSLAYGDRQRELLVIHITLAIVSYVLFSLAFVLSAMYLLQEKLLRSKRWNVWYLRLPSLLKMDTFAFRCIVAGFPLLLLSGILGDIWGWLVLHRLLLFDPKPIATLVLCIMYGTYLAMRMFSGFGGKRLAWFNLLCFFGVILNFWIVGDFSLFHHGV